MTVHEILNITELQIWREEKVHGKVTQHPWKDIINCEFLGRFMKPLWWRINISPPPSPSLPTRRRQCGSIHHEALGWHAALNSRTRGIIGIFVATRISLQDCAWRSFVKYRWPDVRNCYSFWLQHLCQADFRRWCEFRDLADWNRVLHIFVLLKNLPQRKLQISSVFILPLFVSDFINL